MRIPLPDDSNTLAALLPREMQGWSAKAPDGIYTAETLFDLIDGGAEVYLALKVRKVLSRRYEKVGAPEIIVDLFDMGSPADAFGAYRHDMHEGRTAGVGKESEFLDSSLSFWKDRYFVSLIALDETKAVAKGLKAMAEAIADAIPEDGDYPTLAKLLPKDGPAFTRSHYFHGKSLLDRHYFIAEENLLDLDEDTEGLLVRCEPDTPPEDPVTPPEDGVKRPLPVLVLIRYPSVKRAEKAYERFRARYLPGCDAYGMLEKAPKRWAGADRNADLLIAVFDAASRNGGRARIEEILKVVSAAPERTKSHDQEKE